MSIRSPRLDGPADESLTAVIVNYRTPQLVLECVDHLKRFPAAGVATHIVVVDNGSGDDSLMVIKTAHPGHHRHRRRGRISALPRATISPCATLPRTMPC